MSAVIDVRFGAHLDLDRVADMLGSIAAYGNISRTSDRALTVEVVRLSKLPKLKRQLLQWERCGFVHWMEC